MLGRRLFERALGIEEPWYIDKINFDEEDKRLDIHIDFKKGAKFKYTDKEEGLDGKFTAYDTKEKTWRHLNFFQHECYLHARVPRVDIGNGKARRIETPWEGESKGFTLLFEALLLQLCISMPIHQVEKIIGVPDDKIWRMLEKYIEEALELNDYSEVSSIGIDETSSKKGHNYITLFVDLAKRRTIYVTQGKDSTTVENFVEDLEDHNGAAEKIEDVSCDMSKGFKKGVKENFPNGEITFDKFHILKTINEAVDEVRKQEVKENEILRKTKYIFLKNEDNLTEKEKEKLDSIKQSEMNLKTARAYRIRKSFQSIYKAKSREQFIQELDEWYFWATHSKIDPIIEAAKTIKNHWNGVKKWWDSKINNGILEGFNSLIQSAKSKARGYTTYNNLRIIAFLLTGKLDFQNINPAYEKS